MTALLVAAALVLAATLVGRDLARLRGGRPPGWASWPVILAAGSTFAGAVLLILAG